MCLFKDKKQVSIFNFKYCFLPSITSAFIRKQFQVVVTKIENHIFLCFDFLRKLIQQEKKSHNK